VTSELPLAECRLDPEDLRVQSERYRRLREHVESATRHPGRLSVVFDTAVDAALLAETIAVERECCPFFKLDYGGALRRLDISVAEPALDPALDALAYSLGEPAARRG
jgi:hypothetical protein